MKYASRTAIIKLWKHLQHIWTKLIDNTLKKWFLFSCMYISDTIRLIWIYMATQSAHPSTCGGGGAGGQKLPFPVREQESCSLDQNRLAGCPEARMKTCQKVIESMMEWEWKKKQTLFEGFIYAVPCQSDCLLFSGYFCLTHHIADLFYLTWINCVNFFSFEQGEKNTGRKRQIGRN